MSKTINDLWYDFLRANLPASVVNETAQITPGQLYGAGAIPISDSISATGTASLDVTSTAATNVATIAAGSLPVGFYKIQVFTQAPTLTNPATPDSLDIKLNTTIIATPIFHIVAQNSGAYQSKTPYELWRRLDGTQAINVNAKGAMAATEVQVWRVNIVATRYAL